MPTPPGQPCVLFPSKPGILCSQVAEIGFILSVRESLKGLAVSLQGKLWARNGFQCVRGYGFRRTRDGRTVAELTVATRSISKFWQD